jgi:GTP1/Obg family GTP-binding protein
MNDDQFIYRFQALWDEACAESDARAAAKALRNWVAYIKQRYGTLEKHQHFFQEKIDWLEEAEITDARTLYLVASTVSYTRKQVKETARKFGGGLKKKPSKRDLRTIRSVGKGIEIRLEDTDGENADADDHRNGLSALGLDDD